MTASFGKLLQNSVRCCCFIRAGAIHDLFIETMNLVLGTLFLRASAPPLTPRGPMRNGGGAQKYLPHGMFKKQNQIYRSNRLHE